MPLSFSILSSTNESLLTPIISDDALSITILANQSGSARVTVTATDTLNKSRITSLSVTVYDPDSEDFLRNRRAYASSYEGDGHLEGFAVDGDPTTRWSSEYTDNEWIAVEMEEPKTIQRVMLHWEAAYAEEFQIQTSMNGISWNTVYTENEGDGGWDRITFEPVETKYVRMNGLKRATEWGYSLFAFEAYAELGTTSIESLFTKHPCG
jgi:hypothetical protein